MKYEDISSTARQHREADGVYGEDCRHRRRGRHRVTASLRRLEADRSGQRDFAHSDAFVRRTSRSPRSTLLDELAALEKRATRSATVGPAWLHHARTGFKYRARRSSRSEGPVATLQPNRVDRRESRAHLEVTRWPRTERRRSSAGGATAVESGEQREAGRDGASASALKRVSHGKSLGRTVLHVVVVWPNPGIRFEMIERRMQDVAHSWYRLTPTTWVVCSQRDANFWTERLKSLGNVFISVLNLSQSEGWMSQQFWDWLREHV